MVRLHQDLLGQDQGQDQGQELLEGHLMAAVHQLAPAARPMSLLLKASQVNRGSPEPAAAMDSPEAVEIMVGQEAEMGRMVKTERTGLTAPTASTVPMVQMALMVKMALLAQPVQPVLKDLLAHKDLQDPLDRKAFLASTEQTELTA